MPTISLTGNWFRDSLATINRAEHIASEYERLSTALQEAGFPVLARRIHDLDNALLETCGNMRHIARAHTCQTNEEYAKQMARLLGMAQGVLNKACVVTKRKT